MPSDAPGMQLDSLKVSCETVASDQSYDQKRVLIEVGDLTVLYSWGAGSIIYLKTTCQNGTKKGPTNLDVGASGKLPPYVSKWAKCKTTRYTSDLVWILWFCGSPLPGASWELPAWSERN